MFHNIFSSLARSPYLLVFSFFVVFFLLGGHSVVGSLLYFSFFFIGPLAELGDQFVSQNPREFYNTLGSLTPALTDR